jgi:hypothetical protein
VCHVRLAGGTSARGLRACRRSVASARAYNRSQRRRAEVAAPSTEQSGEGGAGNFGRRSRAGREGPTCGWTSIGGLCARLWEGRRNRAGREGPACAPAGGPTEQSEEGGSGLREDFDRRPLHAPAIGAGTGVRKRLH